MNKPGMSIEMARAELQAAMSGPAGRHWSYGPAVSTVLAALEQAEKHTAELLAERDADKRRIAELEARTANDWIEHDGKRRPHSLGKNELVYLKTRKQELKTPYPSGIAKGWTHSGDDMDILAYRLAEPKGEARTLTVKFEPIPMSELGNKSDGAKHPYMFGAGYNSAVVHCGSELQRACAAAGISLKIEGE